MSAIASAAGLVANTDNAASKTLNNSAFANIESGEFVKILLTELTNQDPLQPNDSQAILEQLSSLRNIESQLSLQEKLEQLTLQNSLSQAGGLIGKVVEGIDANDQKVDGKVVSVRLGEKGAELELDTGRKLSLEKVSRITDGNTLATAA